MNERLLGLAQGDNMRYDQQVKCQSAWNKIRDLFAACAHSNF